MDLHRGRLGPRHPSRADLWLAAVDLDGALPIDARVGRPEGHLTCSRVDQPSVLEISLISHSRRDLINVHSAKIEH